jgi:hypothetical protein
VYMVLLYRKGLNEKTGGIMVINLEMVKVLASIRV